MEYRRFVIDSSVLVALYNSGDSLHQKAVEIFQELDAQVLIIHPYVIQETATVLAYKLGQKVAVKFLNDIEDAVNVIIPSMEIRDNILCFIEVKKKISFTDAVIIDLAKSLNAKLITFDRQMLKLFNSK